MKEDQSCGSCVWFKEETREGGNCRFNPPQMVVVPKMQQRLDQRTKQLVNVQQLVAQGMFPMMSKDDPGCGQFKERQDED